MSKCSILPSYHVYASSRPWVVPSPGIPFSLLVLYLLWVRPAPILVLSSLVRIQSKLSASPFHGISLGKLLSLPWLCSFKETPPWGNYHVPTEGLSSCSSSGSGSFVPVGNLSSGSPHWSPAGLLDTSLWGWGSKSAPEHCYKVCPHRPGNQCWASQLCHFFSFFSFIFATFLFWCGIPPASLFSQLR